MSTVSTMRSNVYQALAEVSGDSNKRVTPDDVLGELNAEYVEVCRETDILQEEVSVATVTGQRLYALPAGMYNLKAVRCEPASSSLNPTTQDDLAYRSPAWRQAAAGTPSDVYLNDGRNFGVYPPPAAGQGPLHVDGYLVPSSAEGASVALLAADSDEPAFNAAFHKVLEYGAVARICLSKLADSPVAAAKAQWAQAERANLIAEMKLYRSNGIGLDMRRG